MDGMIAYMLEFDFLANLYLERDGSLAKSAPESAKRGEEIFHRPFSGMNGRSCATCHIPSANFIDHRRHDLGVVAGSAPFSRDGALDTPTLLGITHTPPYFHDGSQASIHAVSEWFNERFDLGLTERELTDLTSYVETVGDGIEPYEDTRYTLEMELEEFGFFLSAYEYLKKIGNWELIEMTVKTIAQEIHAHKWDMQEREYMPVLNLMAELMEDAGDAGRAGDYETVDFLVAEYRAIYSEYAELIY
jgi:mono/diheme cytochrome c family protein